MVYLEGRVAQLESGRYPYNQPIWPTTPSQYTLQCSKCGMKLSGVMGYVCADNDCPTFLKATCGIGNNISTTGG